MTVIPQHYKGTTKREKVEVMFDSIATRYDLMNKILSAGIDKSWRRKTVDQIAGINPQYILDIATGTADLALECMRLRPIQITGIDISHKMLDIGRHKIMEKGFQGIIRLEQGDSENLPYKDNSFDAITVAFGVRNFEHLEDGLKEMHRVLRPGGKVVILEFSQPDRFPVKQLYRFYSSSVMPRLGQLLASERSAYEYLPASVSVFPFGKKMLDILEHCGFRDTNCIPLTFGIASIYSASK